LCTKERYKKAQQTAINLEQRLGRRRARQDREKRWPIQGHPKTFHSLLGRSNKHQNRVGKREKTLRAIGRIKMTGWIINIPILLV
jgi:hypothetical protein